MRLFVALPLPGETALAVSRWMDSAKGHWPDIRWVRLEQVHLTLRFFGDVPPGRVEEVRGALSSGSFGPVPFRIDRTGTFERGRGGLPSVYWLGGEFGGGLMDLVRPLAAIPDGEGKTENPSRFRAHLTVARQGRSDRKAALPPPGILTGTMDRVLMIDSTLTSSGPQYEVLFSRGLARVGGGD
jgi:2'-5' RNA ligase